MNVLAEVNKIQAFTIKHWKVITGIFVIGISLLIAAVIVLKPYIGQLPMTGSRTITICTSGTQGQNGCDYIGGAGIKLATDNASSADTTIIMLKPGTYNLEEKIEISGKKIEISVDPSNRTDIAIIQSNSSSEYGFYIRNKSSVSFAGTELNSNTNGIYVETSNFSIKNSAINSMGKAVNCVNSSCIVDTVAIMLMSNADGITCWGSYGYLLACDVKNTTIDTVGNNLGNFGISCDGSSTVCTISGNRIIKQNRGLYCNTNCTIKNNRIENNTMGVFCNDQSKGCVLSNNLIKNNFVGIYNKGFSTEFINNTIVSNQGGITCDVNSPVKKAINNIAANNSSSGMECTFTILKHNLAFNNPINFLNHEENITTADIYHNIISDPLFNDNDPMNSLESNSPAYYSVNNIQYQMGWLGNGYPDTWVTPLVTNTPLITPTLLITVTTGLTNTPIPTNTIKPIATNTPVPTNTMRPTATSTPRPIATNTPRPTNTPKPTTKVIATNTAVVTPIKTATPTVTTTLNVNITATAIFTVTVKPTTDNAMLTPTLTATATPAGGGADITSLILIAVGSLLLGGAVGYMIGYMRRKTTTEY